MVFEVNLQTLNFLVDKQNFSLANPCPVLRHVSAKRQGCAKATDMLATIQNINFQMKSLRRVVHL